MGSELERQIYIVLSAVNAMKWQDIVLLSDLSCSWEGVPAEVAAALRTYSRHFNVGLWSETAWYSPWNMYALSL